MKPRQPLDGIKILEFARVVAGPVAGKMLADYGAKVVKIETIQHIDALRSTPPYKDFKAGINNSSYFTKCNTNKYGLGLNLQESRGKEIFKKLVQWCDVLLECNAPGVATKFDVTYPKMRAIKPDLIMIQSSMYGQEGPLSKFKAYGAQSASAAGFYDFVSYPDSPPVGPFGAYTDLLAYHSIAIAIMAALLYRKRTGKGAYMDHSQVEAGVLALTPAVLNWTANHRTWPRTGNRNPLASPHGFYRCQGDDRWCSITVYTDEQWLNLCCTFGREEWISDARFSTLLARKKNEDEIDKLVEEWTLQHTAEYVMHQLQSNNVPAGIVANGADLFMDPQLRARGYYVELDHPDIGRHTHERPPHIFSKTPAYLWGSGPALGQHNEYVCREILGYSDEEIANLFAEGVLESS